MTVLIAVMGDVAEVDAWIDRQPRQHWQNFRVIHKKRDAIGMEFDAIRIIGALVSPTVHEFVRTRLRR